MKSKYLLLMLTTLLFLSCEDVVNVESKNPLPETIIVDGLILDVEGKSYVKLTKSLPYFADEQHAAVKSAVVTLTNSKGQTTSFEENSDGMYFCPSQFKGEAGEVYQLNVEVNGKTITAQSSLAPAVPIENLRIEFIEEGDPDMRKGYYLFGKFSDPKNAKNYFKAEVFVNGARQQKNASDLIVFDDRLIENLEGVEGQFGYWENLDDDDYKLNKGDKVALKLYAIDYKTYLFYKALADTPGQGGLFGKNPANVPSNVKGALGIFQAVSVSESEEIMVNQ